MELHRASLLVVSLFLLACPGFGDEEVNNVPLNPTYLVEVKPILDAHCVPCHVVPPLNGAPGGFRLDQYSDDGLGNGGAFTVRGLILDQAVNLARMPPANRPDLATSAFERAVLEQWIANGAPES